MKAIQLIRKLQREVEEHGEDIECIIRGDQSVHPFTKVKVIDIVGVNPPSVQERVIYIR